AVLDRAAQRLKSAERVLLLELPGETVRVPLYAIDYLEVRQNYVTVHADKEYTVKKTLGAMESALDDRFFRAGRSYILNLSRVRSVTKNEVLLVNGVRIPLPRGMYEPLNRAIIQKM
ncbi:MAG: LytR/AlgR family response regulator transcription factor, partial [Acutalibacteraceae bacterium]